MADVRDCLGCLRKEYLPRQDPIRKWRSEKFIAKYRLTRQRVKALGKLYSASGMSRTAGTSVGGGQSHTQQMSLAIRYMATGANFQTIAETQGVTIATVSRCVEDVCTFFYRFSNRFIRWPHTRDAKVQVAKEFHNNYKKKPLVIGCVDGTHVQIVSPKREREAVFVNRKGYYSLNVMVVCDSNNIITHLDPGFAGSAADAYVFNSSPLKDDAESGRWGDFFLLGDSGYGLKCYLLTPYHNPTTKTEKLFNVWHTSTRSVVERTIGILKQRWRCLDQSGGYLHHTPEKAAHIVTACACLHNIAVGDRAPILDHLDDAEDRFIYQQEAPHQPRDFNPNRRRGVITRRDRYARTWFGPTMEEQDDE